MVARRVLVEEADGARRIAVRAEDDLEEGFGHGDAVLAADGLVRLPVEDGAADDEQPSFPLCPVAARFLQFFPVAPVQVVVLRADVGHVEALLHGPPVPAVVAGGAHVPAVPARAFVVVGGDGHVFGQIGVGQELVRAAFAFDELVGRQFPGHPVGQVVLQVAGDGVAAAHQDFLGRAFQGGGQQDLVCQGDAHGCGRFLG